MKHIFFILTCVLLINLNTEAQYRANKTKYDYHTYKHQFGDPYDPLMNGIASFLIPGLGQMASGEIGRGAIFLAGFVGSCAIFGIGEATWYVDSTGEHGGPGLVYLGFASMAVVDIWSVFDAVHVAKVNNLAFRDKDKKAYLQVNPYFGALQYGKGTVGISFKIRF